MKRQKTVAKAGKQITYACVGVFDGRGTSLGKLGLPHDVAVIPEGFVFVDKERRLLGKVKGGEVHSVSLYFPRDGQGSDDKLLGVKLGEVSDPHAVGIDPGGRILVGLTRVRSGWGSDEDQQILVFDENLVRLGQFGKDHKCDGPGPIGTINNVTGIACSTDGRIFLAEHYGHRIQVFDRLESGPEGMNTESINWFGNKWRNGLNKVKQAGDFDYPTDVFVSGEEVAACDSFSSCIHLFDLEGRPRALWSVCEEEFEVNRFTAVVRLPSGEFLAVCEEKNRIAVLGATGKLLGYIGRPGPKPGELLGAQGLDVDGNGRVYIADTGNRRIQIWKINI